jgi:hypothetical protein
VLGGFWTAVSGKLVDRWAGLGSAVVFWAGLLVVRLWAHGGWDQAGRVSSWLRAQPDVGVLVVLLGGLLLATAPAVLVTWVSTPVLRLVEGYWPAPIRRVQDRRLATQRRKLAADLVAFQGLAARQAGTVLTRDEADRFARLDGSLHHRPGDPDRLMATRVGNVLRAAEDRPRHAYGLDPVIVWPRLWLVLPDTARQELAAARGALDSAVAAVVWGVLFAVAAPLTAAPGRHAWLPGLVGVALGVAIAVAAGVWWVAQRAMVFADLLDSAFDLYRFDLYAQVRWPLPANPQVEPGTGNALTRYLWRGSACDQPTFTNPDRHVDPGRELR